MFYRNILTMLNLRFKDPDQEKEYLSLKIPLLQTFFTYLLASVVVLLIPLSIHFFFIIDYPKQGIMAIVMLFIAVLIFFLRKPLGRWMEYLVLGYLLAVVGLVVFNLYFIIATLNFCEAFYSGYAFALLHRILGYRVVQLHSMLIFHLASLLLRLTIFVKHGIPISLMITALEVLTICLSVQSERGERSLFDSLYKSKKQLEKFKDFLTEHLPSPMSIFPQDHSTAYFINNSFKRTLGCEDKSQAKDALRTLVLDQESLEKNSELLEKMRSFISSTGQTLRLSKVLGLLSKSSALIRGTTTLTFQVREEENNVESSEVYSNKSEEDFLKESDTPTIRRGAKKNKTNGTGISLTPRENSDGDKDGKDIEANALVKEIRRRIFQVKVFLLPWDGSEAMAVILDDVTQQRTIMELKIADKNKDLVIAMVSHELRTPLNGMLGLMDILKKIVGNDAQSYLAACRNSGLFLLNLVNSILDMSQIRNNKLKLFHSEIILLDLLNEVKSLFESFCSTKSVYLRLNVGKNVPKIIFTDRNRLSQILINLLGNAFKFTFEGGITLSVDLEGKDSNRIRFSIQDTGLGIKKEDQEKLFKLFGRLEQQDGRINTNGVGLGLTISNNLAILLDTPMNDGCQRGIHVESELGRGSTFYFIIESRTQGLECASPDDVSIYDVQPPTEELRLSPKMTRYSTIQALNFGKMRGMQTSIGTPNDNDTLSCKDPYMALGLKMENRGKSLEDVCSNRKEVKDRERNEKPWCLIVDDNPFNIIVASHLLGDGGYQLKKAMNGQEAIQEVKKHAQEKLEPFKVVLMDCQMPVMDGYQATKILKEMIKKGEVPQFPILALSSNNRDEDHEKLCTEVGMDGSVTKPLKVEELEDAIKKLNKKKGQEGAS